MTRAEAKTLLPVIQAWAEGKEVQWRRRGNESENWFTPAIDTSFELANIEWHIKPTLREWLICPTCRCIVDAFKNSEQAHKLRYPDHEVVHVREVLP